MNVYLEWKWFYSRGKWYYEESNNLFLQLQNKNLTVFGASGPKKTIPLILGGGRNAKAYHKCVRSVWHHYASKWYQDMEESSHNHTMSRKYSSRCDGVKKTRGVKEMKYCVSAEICVVCHQETQVVNLPPLCPPPPIIGSEHLCEHINKVRLCTMIKIPQ